MKFRIFKEFRLSSVSEVAVAVSQYLSTEMAAVLKDLNDGLRKLSFADNFQSFTTTVTIPAASEVSIRNPLGAVPTGRIILRGGSGSQDIVDGSTVWSQNFVYLQNLGGSPVTVTVVFFI